MREIKFRAWDREKKLMSAPENLQSIVLSPENFNQYGDLEFMQYTGLKDKNGKEIYEGDILNDQFNCGQYFVVVWSDDSCKFFHKKIVVEPDSFGFGKPEYDLKKEDCLKCEVVGNVYENPELLTSHTT